MKFPAVIKSTSARVIIANRHSLKVANINGSLVKGLLEVNIILLAGSSVGVISKINFAIPKHKGQGITSSVALPPGTAHREFVTEVLDDVAGRGKGPISGNDLESCHGLLVEVRRVKVAENPPALLGTAVPSINPDVLVIRSFKAGIGTFCAQSNILKQNR